MKKLYLSLKDENVSWPLLMISFLAGVITATILFYFWGHTINTLAGI